MKIVLDCSKAVNEKAGVARYTWQIASHLPKIGKNDQFLYSFNFLRGGKEKKQLIKKLVANNKNIDYKICHLPGNLKENILATSFSFLDIWLKNFDLYHAVEFLSFDQGLKIPQILTVHDLTFLKFPEHLGERISQRYTKMLKLACQKATFIIATSQSTKKDIMQYFSVPENKIRITYQGAEVKFKKINNVLEIKRHLEKYRLKFPFLLFVGTIEPRKNIKNLLLAFEDYLRSSNDQATRLVLIGKKGWNTAEVEETHQKLIHKEKVIFLDYIPDEDLVYFYNGARIFIYPSLYEGFGLPVLEAMSCGVPVITSNVSSLPEVGGNAALYINPQKTEQIALAIKKIIFDEKTESKMRQASLAQAKKFSWDKCARETYKIYQEVTKNAGKNKRI